MKIRKLKVRKNAKHPGESIIAYAHREGCDLIVTGTRAQYSRERMWEESISNYCVWHSWIPVLGKIDHVIHMTVENPLRGLVVKFLCFF